MKRPAGKTAAATTKAMKRPTQEVETVAEEEKATKRPAQEEDTVAEEEEEEEEEVVAAEEETPAVPPSGTSAIRFWGCGFDPPGSDTD